MNKQEIIRYISGESTSAEQQAVQSWINQSKENLDYFLELKNLWMAVNMPQGRASKEEMQLVDTIINTKESSSPQRRSFKRHLVAASILLLLGLNLFFLLDKFSSKKEVVANRVPLTSLPTVLKNTIYTNNGVKGVVDLPDGSKVWLNSSSKITYPTKFEGSTREVEISGECYFEVVTDSINPMIVSTNKNFKIKVTGTKFNVRSYEDDNQATVTLIEGAIEVLKKNRYNNFHTSTTIAPNQTYTTYDQGKESNVAESSSNHKEVAWREGTLIFDRTPMAEVIKELQRWHGTEFIVQDKKILNNQISAEFNSESIVQIMEMLKFCAPIDCKINGNKVWLFSK